MSRATYGVNAYAIPNITLAGGVSFSPSVLPGNEAVSIFWPRVRPEYGVKGVLFLIHGAGGAAKLAGSGGYYEGLQNYFCNQLGYIVCAADFGSNGTPGGAATNPDTWASNVAMGALDAAYKWATGAFNAGTSTSTDATHLNDTTQSFPVSGHVGKVVTSGGKTGIITANTATQLTVNAWTGGTPGTGTYTISGHFTDTMPYGKTAKVGLVGISMGGWIARNWASRNTGKVAFIIDIGGVVSAPYIYGVAPNGSSMDYGYGPAVPPSAPNTPTGTAGATAYKYASCETCPLGDGPNTAQTASANLGAQATLNTTPNTITGFSHPAANASGQPITGTKVLRSVGGAALTVIDTVGQTKLSAATGLSAVTTLTCAPLPFAIPSGTIMQLSHPTVAEGYGGTNQSTTQTVTLSSAAAQGATSISVTSFTPASGDVTVAWGIGTKVKLATYVDKITGGGTAFTGVAANGTSVTTGAYGVNGKGANPSYDPLDATNLTAGLKAIKCQYWWSCNDVTSSTGSGVPGTVNAEVQTYATAYGANLTLQEVPTDPVHNLMVTSMVASPSALATLASFIAANAP